MLCSQNFTYSATLIGIVFKSQKVSDHTALKIISEISVFSMLEYLHIYM